MNAILSEKGQVTIPKNLRDSLGLRPGVVLDFTEEQGRLIVRKIIVENVFEKWSGKASLPAGVTVDEYLQQTRGV